MHTYVAMCVCPPEPFMCNEPMKQVPQVTAFMSNKVAIIIMSIITQNYHDHFINFSNASFIP